MTFTEPSFASVLVFLAVVGAVALALPLGIWTASAAVEPKRRTLRLALAVLGMAAWISLTGLISGSGILQAEPLPRLPIFLGTTLLLALALALSPVGGWLARGIPLAALVGFQGFRLPLEGVLHSWAAQGTIPETMTWTGQNFDVATGALALLLAPVIRRLPANDQRKVARAFNAFGALLLLNVARVAVLSSPLPFAWHVEPPLQLGFHFPYSLIVTVCVAGALVGHVVLARALRRPPNS